MSTFTKEDLREDIIWVIKEFEEKQERMGEKPEDHIFLCHLLMDCKHHEIITPEGFTFIKEKLTKHITVDGCVYSVFNFAVIDRARQQYPRENLGTIIHQKPEVTQFFNFARLQFLKYLLNNLDELWSPELTS